MPDISYQMRLLSEMQNPQSPMSTMGALREFTGAVGNAWQGYQGGMDAQDAIRYFSEKPVSPESIHEFSTRHPQMPLVEIYKYASTVEGQKKAQKLKDQWKTLQGAIKGAREKGEDFDFSKINEVIPDIAPDFVEQISKYKAMFPGAKIIERDPQKELTSITGKEISVLSPAQPKVEKPAEWEAYVKALQKIKNPDTGEKYTETEAIEKYKSLGKGTDKTPTPPGKKEEALPGGMVQDWVWDATKKDYAKLGVPYARHKTETGDKTGQNWILPDRSTVISYDGGKSYVTAQGQSKPMPSSAVKVPGGASLGELNMNQAKQEAQQALAVETPAGGRSPKGAALEGTGPYGRIASAFEAVAGGLGADLLIGEQGFFPNMADAKQFLRSVKQMGKAALMNSSRGAIWEQQKIDELFPDPDKTFTNPRIEARKFANLLEVLGQEEKFNNQAIVSALTPKEVERYRTSNNEIKRLRAFISEPQTGGITAQDKSLVDKYLRRQ